MCDICIRWKSKKLTTKEVFDLIGQNLKQASKKDADHLMELSSKILDEDVPMPKSDKELDKEFYRRQSD